MFGSFRDLAFLGAAMGGGELWTPAAITTALWLDAADASTVTTVSGAVSEWRDKSGNGRNATQPAPSDRPTYSSTAFNNKPGLVFNGENSNLNHQLAGPSQWTLIAVFQINSLQTGFRGIFAIGPANLSGGSILLARTDSADAIGTYTSNTVNSTSVNTVGQMRIAIMEDDDSTAGVKGFFVNGTAAGTFTGNPIGQPSTIGGVSSQRLAGTIAECIVLPLVAAIDTRQRIEGYLAHRWDLTASLPSDHPYKTTAPTV
jgi:hypothetical protein